jgi:hypothetical protein
LRDDLLTTVHIAQPNAGLGQATQLPRPHRVRFHGQAAVATPGVLEGRVLVGSQCGREERLMVFVLASDVLDKQREERLTQPGAVSHAFGQPLPVTGVAAIGSRRDRAGCHPSCPPLGCVRSPALQVEVERADRRQL